MSTKKNKLFEGLSKNKTQRDTDILAGKEYIEEIKLDSIRANPFQPRKVFQEELLLELGKNIKKNGLDQPIVVVRDNKNAQGFVLVSGERRVRASKMVELTHIKAIIREYNDTQMNTKALWENILREDLNPIEKYYSILSIKQQQNIKSIKELSKYLNIGYSYLRRLLSIGKLNKESLKIYENSSVSLHVIERLSTVPEEKVSSYLNYIVGKKLSSSLALDYINSMQTTKEEEKLKTSSKKPLYLVNTTKAKYSFIIDRKELPEAIDKEIEEKFKEIEILLQQNIK